MLGGSRSRVLERPSFAMVQASLKAMAADDGKQDQEKLKLLIEEGDLDHVTRKAFTGMLEVLESGRFVELTRKQRGWMHWEMAERGLSVVLPAQRNKNVPKGKPVEPAPVLRNLPKYPPGRKPKE